MTITFQSYSYRHNIIQQLTHKKLAMMKSSDLSLPHVHRLAIISAGLVLQKDSIVEREILTCRDLLIDREEVREAILQTYLFDGYPTALEGMFLLQKCWEGKPEPVEAGNYGEWYTWRIRGTELYNRIYGSVADKLQNIANSVSPELARWMLIEGYGKTLSRGALSIQVRELLCTAVLSVKNRPRQLRSHIRGALRVGVGKSEILEMLNILGEEFTLSLLDAYTLLEREDATPISE